MSESLTFVTETKKPSDGCSSSESIFQKRIEFRPTNKHSPVFSNGGSSSSSGGSANFPIENQNPISKYSQKSNSNGRVLSSLMEKNQWGDGLDPDLGLRTTFRKIGAGLENLGNTCFLNSVLQCLTYTEPFAAYLQSGKHNSSCHISGFCALCAIQKHVRRALQSNGRILAPTDLVINLQRISRNFCYARQEDAHEYMVNLLESMHKCCLPSGLPSESPKAYEKSLVHKIFGGRLRSQVKCVECSYSSNKYDPFLDLSLEIAKADSLHDALLHFTEVEQLDGGERQYQCQNCKQKVKAERQLTILRAPYVLSIHLKRFGSLIPGQKINKEIKFSPTLDLKPFYSGTYEGGLKYTLYGVLVHAGWSTHSGHYYCYVRTSSGTWYLLDDDEVFEVRETDVLKQRAYMLFYVRDRRNHAPKRPVDMFTKGSSFPVSSPILTKSNTVPSDSMKKSISESPSILTTQGSLIEGAAVTIGSLESSLKSVFDVCSVQHSMINHMRGESLPCTDPSAVQGGGTLSHPCIASSDPKTEVINEPGETRVTNSHITSEGSPIIIDSSVVKTEGSISHPPGAKANNICEDNETMKDLTGSVATLSDCNMQEFCSTATDMEHENASLIEMESDKEANKKVNGLESDEVDLMQLSSHSGTEESFCKKLSDAILSHPTGAKTNNICEHNETMKDLTGSVATLSDCNMQEFCSTATFMEHENASLIEMESDKEASKKVGDEVDLMQLSSRSGTEESFCKNLSDAILSHPTSAKGEEKFEHKETMKSSPVAAFTDCNVLQVFASKTSATDMEERASVIVMDSCAAVSKEVSELGSDEVDSMRLSNLSGTEESLFKASELTISVDKSNNIMSHPIDKTAEVINEQKETMNDLACSSCHTPCLSRDEGSISKASEVTISVDKSNSIMSHPIDKTAEDKNEQKETMNDLTWYSCHTPCLSGTEGSLSNASELTIPVDKSDSIISHPIDKTAEDINEQKENMNDLTSPVATLPDCNISTTSAIDMECEKASVIEMKPEKALSIEVNELGFDEVDFVQLSSQSGIKEPLCKKVSVLGPEIVGLVPLSSQLGTENEVCQSVRDFGPEEVDSRILSQSDAEEAICKGVSDFGPGEVNLMQVSNQLGTENAVCQSVRDFGPQEVDSRVSSQLDAEEAICKGVIDFGPGEIELMQISNQLGPEEVCKSISNSGSGEGGSMTLSSRQNTEYEENGDILNERVLSYQQNAEENGHTLVETMSVDSLIQSRMTSRCDQKEVLNHLHCQKVLKPKKHLKKFQVASIHLGSSLLFRAPSWIRRKKNHKKSRKRSLERSKSIPNKIGENSISGLEPSTSEQTRTVTFDSSLPQRQKDNSGANNRNCRKTRRDDSYGDSSTKLVVQVESRERSGLNGAVPVMHEPPVKRSCSTLTSNSCHYKESDSSQDRRSSVNDFMSMLTRGLDETTVTCWEEIDSHRSESLGSNKRQSISTGYVSDEWDVEYDRGKRKKVRSTKNSLGGRNAFQKIATMKNRLKKAKMDQSSSGNRPFRI